MTIASPESSSWDFETQRPEQFLGPRGFMRYFNAPNGTRLCGYYFPASGQPKAVVQVLHGHGSYLCFEMLKNRGPGKFCTYAGSWIEALNEAGYSVCGIDNQGSGRSEGLRCYCDTFDDYVDGVISFMELTDKLDLAGFPTCARKHAHNSSGTQLDKGVPRYMIGESLGGCLATMSAIRRPDLVAGIVLLAPMISLEKLSKKGINRALKFIAPVVANLIPTWQVIQTSRNTLYPDLQQTYDQDPHCWHNKTRARNGYEYTRTTAWLMKEGVDQVTCPFLVCHGLHDDMCDLDGSKALYHRAKSTDKTLKLLDHMWHILIREPGNTGLLADIIEWMDKRVANYTTNPQPTNQALLDRLREESAVSLAQASKQPAARPVEPSLETAAVANAANAKHVEMSDMAPAAASVKHIAIDDWRNAPAGPLIPAGAQAAVTVKGL